MMIRNCSGTPGWVGPGTAGAGRVWRAGVRLCHTGRVPAPSLSDSLALVAADPALAGHPVVAGLLTAVERELVERLRVLEVRVAAQDEELADLRRQLGRHSGNRGQPPC